MRYSILFLTIFILTFSSLAKDGKINNPVNRIRGLYYTNPEKAIALVDSIMPSLEVNNRKIIAHTYRFKAIAYYYLEQFDEALEALNKGLNFCSLDENPEEMNAKYFNVYGSIYGDKGEILKSNNFYKKALDIYTKVAFAPGIRSVKSNMAGNYFNLGEYNSALKLYKEILDMGSGESGHSSELLNGVGNVYYHLKKNQLAKKYFKASLNKAEIKGDIFSKAAALSNIGNTYYSEDSLDIALSYYEDALEIDKRYQTAHGSSVVLHNIGIIHAKRGSYKKSNDYLYRSAMIEKEVGNAAGYIRTMISISTNFSALDEAEKGYEILKDIENSPVLKSNNTINKNYQMSLIPTLIALGKKKEANDHFNQFAELSKEIFNKETAEEAAKLDTKYSLIEKESEVALLKKENELAQVNSEKEKISKNRTNIILISIVGMLLIAFSSIYFILKERKSIIEEKEKISKLTYSVLPKIIANEMLKSNEKIEPQNYKGVSVLFVDIVDFTDHCQFLGASFVIRELNDIYSTFDDILERHDCVRIKTIGDAYLAISSLSDENGERASNLVEASFEMINYLKLRGEKYNVKWEARLGIDSGEIVGGIMGKTMYLYDIFGDTVNSAQRMQTYSEPMKLNISSNTRGYLDERRYKFELREKVEVKGKGEIDMSFVYPLEI